MSDEFFDTSKSVCRNYPTNWWFPDKGREHFANSKKAITLCQQCTVKTECLKYSLVHETYGIWGGLRETERETERRRLKIQLSPTAQANMSASTRRMSRRLNEVNL